MRSYQPERSLYAALWCYAHGHAGMQVGSMQSERMQNTHTLSLFFPQSCFYMIYSFFQFQFFLHTPAQKEKGIAGWQEILVKHHGG